jgi:hypothetical protein
MEKLPIDPFLTKDAGSLYFALEIDKKVKAIKPPYKVDYAIKDFGHSLAVVLKEEQIMDRPQSQIDIIMEWAQKVALTIEMNGIKCYVIGRKSIGG